MKRHRIFIAINLPDYIKKKILDWQQEWADLPVRWTKEPSLHITLVFIGYVNDEEMLDICQLAKEISQRHQPFEIHFNRVYLGPPHRPARMIWLEGEKNLELAKLKDDLENSLLDSAQSGFNRRETRAFQPHITLARIRQWEWQKINPQPQIEKQVDLSFEAGSMGVMESQLLRSGAEYTVLESVELGK